MMYGKLCTKFYDADKKFASPEEINFCESIFNKSDLILEPMCGSGRLLIPLLQAGYTVHGLDNSSDMLHSCRNRASELGLQPTLFEDEVERMKLPQKYDGIVIPFGSFQLFYPRANAFHALEVLKEHLKPNGKLMLDLFVPWDALYENNEEEQSEREVETNDGSIIKIDSHSTANKYEQFILSKTKYSELVHGNVVCQEEEQMHIAWYYRYEMELILEKFGFKNIHYQTRFLNNSDHMTFIAEN
ncbi:MAG: methyltransferase type 12 [uncultured bacterium]|nr:MAG: methyltransferase type 12 [uncultured bacterium]